MRVALATPSGDDEWSSYSSALGRRFLNLDAFLKGNAGAPTGRESVVGAAAAGEAAQRENVTEPAQ